MKWRFLLPTVLLLTVAALIFFLLFFSSYDVPQQQIEKQQPADTKTSQRASERGISTDMAQSDLDLPSRIRSLFDDLPKLNEREQEKCAEEIAEQENISSQAQADQEAREAQRIAKEEAKANGMAKLIALGLTEEEAGALIG
jgi:hypothetical protein